MLTTPERVCYNIFCWGLGKIFALATFYAILQRRLDCMDILISAISILATVLALIEPFSKKMKTALLINFVVNALVGINYLLEDLYGGISGAVICSVAIICLAINFRYTSKDMAIPNRVIALNAAIFTTANLVTFLIVGFHLYDILALIACLLFVLQIGQKNTKYYRLFYICNSLVWIPYDIFANSYGNLFTHSVLAVAILISIFVRDVKKK